MNKLIYKIMDMKKETLILMKKISRNPMLSEKDCFGWREDSCYYLVNENGARIDILIEYFKQTGTITKTFKYHGESYDFQNIKELKKDVNFNTTYRLCTPWKYNF